MQDDTKLCSNVNSQADCDSFQDDLNRLSTWAEDWQMSFNVDKCKIMHIGSSNQSHKYTMNDKPLNSVTEEKDLGVLIHNSLKTSHHCAAAAKKANRTLGIIKRNISHKSKFVIMKLFNSLVRPHIEYAVQFWNPHYKKDIDLLEKIQRRATKLIPELRNLSYADRLRTLNITTLEERRRRGDLIQVFRLIKGFDKSDYELLFKLHQTSRTRGHSLKLVKSTVRLDTRKYFFSQRVISQWNNLPEHIIQAKTIVDFKIRLDQYMNNTRDYMSL
ncbi:uncharacterized protein LOC144438765 [Glandiceps talaboti]